MIGITAGRNLLASLICVDFENTTPMDALKQVGVTAVYPLDVPVPAKPYSVTVFWTGMDAEFLHYEVRLYGIGIDPVQAQVDMEAIVEVLDELINAPGQFGPSAWDHGVTSGEQNSLSAICRLSLGRDDF